MKDNEITRDTDNHSPKSTTLDKDKINASPKSSGRPDRKQECVNIAFGLFMEHGYENTTVQMIMSAMNISKGGFYHYFKTKEDILHDLAAQMASQSRVLLQPLVDDPAFPALDKLNRMFSITNGFKAQNRQTIVTFARVFYSNSNILLRKKITENSMNVVLPILSAILKQGKGEGVFSIDHPEATAWLILCLGNELSSAYSRFLVEQADAPEPMADQAMDSLLSLIRTYTQGVERILGLPPHTLVILNSAMIEILTGKGGVE